MTHDSDATHEERIRERAYELWLAEGCPEGRAEAHWEMAREMLAGDDGHEQHAAQPAAAEDEAPPATLASEDQGDDVTAPVAARPFAAR